MDTTNEVSAAPKWTPLKHWGYYSLWWAVIMGIGSGLMPVTGPALDQFWIAKLYQTAFGIAFGLVCALIFTLTQNTWNVGRKKPVSWAFAIAIWMAGKFIVAWLSGAF
jgi:hypothetical protein